MAGVEPNPVCDPQSLGRDGVSRGISSPARSTTRALAFAEAQTLPNKYEQSWIPTPNLRQVLPQRPWILPKFHLNSI
jgi:hypothetical protein